MYNVDKDIVDHVLTVKINQLRELCQIEEELHFFHNGYLWVVEGKYTGNVQFANGNNKQELYSNLCCMILGIQMYTGKVKGYC